MFRLCLLFVTGALAVSYNTEFLDERVDHFSYANNDTFLLRYLINDTYWDKNVGPILLFTGGEESIEFFVANAGFVWETAEKVRALVVFAEHRYQGWSKPYEGKTFSTLRQAGYLSVQQVLADFAGLIVYLRSQFPQLANSPVITMGFGYSGQLAAWMRVKYPHLVQGAVASSAPVVQQSAPCNMFPRLVTSAFNSTSNSCVAAIKRSWDVINRVSYSHEGLLWLHYSWNLCHPLYTTHAVFMLKSWLSSVYMYLSYYNYPYPAKVGVSLPANPIQEFCRPLADTANLPDDRFLLALFQALNVFTNYSGKAHCLDTYQVVLLEKATPAHNFLLCSELPSPMCPEGGDNDMFEPVAFSRDWYGRSCHSRWGVWPQGSFVARTFGSLGQGTTSNIVLTNGLLDPHIAGSVLHNVSDAVEVFNIPGGAHHIDFRYSDPADPPAVIQAREFVVDRITGWVMNASQIEPR